MRSAHPLPYPLHSIYQAIWLAILIANVGTLHSPLATTNIQTNNIGQLCTLLPISYLTVCPRTRANSNIASESDSVCCHAMRIVQPSLTLVFIQPILRAAQTKSLSVNLQPSAPLPMTSPPNSPKLPTTDHTESTYNRQTTPQSWLESESADVSIIMSQNVALYSLTFLQRHSFLPPLAHSLQTSWRTG